MRREQKAIRSLFSRLRRAPLHRFPRRGRALLCPARHGVYLIIDRVGRVAHVGRTTRGQDGLLQRLQNHLAGQSSFVILYLKGRPSRLRNGYWYSWLVISNPRTRALVEAYATGVLCPRHIGTGKAAA